METITEFLIDWGYWGLFLSALIAGSVLPFSSEAVMVVLTAMEIQHIGEPFSVEKADEYLRSGKVVVFGGGVGSPFFTTDTGAVLRAALIGADAVLLAKNVDGVYSADPKKDPDAVRFDSLTYEEVLKKRLAVMDSTATCIAMDNRIPIKVFALREPENILRAARGEAVGTLVH